MLQQTTVAAVIPYYESFLTRFPDVGALARSDVSEVMRYWAGLGYYARARNLHACARAVAANGGRFPDTVGGLRALPGIGEYTSAAIAAIAFGLPALPVDGNVERVVARLFGIADALPAGKRPIRAAAARLGTDPASRVRPADFVQALFDLGATICTPSRPACALCPWHASCVARRDGTAENLPVRSAKPVRPVRHGVHFWLTDADGEALLRRRPPRGLLGGMVELPGTPWRSSAWSREEAMAFAPAQTEWRPAGSVRHGFTHFELRIDLFAGEVARIAPASGLLHPARSVAQAGLPSVMRKCVAAVTAPA